MRNLKQMPRQAPREPVTGLNGAEPVNHVTVRPGYVTLGAVVWTDDGMPARHPVQRTGHRRAWHS